MSLKTAKSVILCDRCQWCWKNNFRWKTCRKLKDQGKKVVLGGSGYLPCSSRGTADRMGPTAGVEIIGGREGLIRHQLSMMQWQQPRPEMQTF